MTRRQITTSTGKCFLTVPSAFRPAASDPVRPKNEVLEFRNGGRIRRSVADLAGGWFARSKRDEISAVMLTSERGGTGFLIYAFAVLTCPL
jgi:hypothetical protein